MALRPDWWPTADDWLQAAERLHLERRGSELVGPCPACNGTDRFHVHWRGPRRGVFACRHGCSWRPILEAAGFGRPENRREAWFPGRGPPARPAGGPDPRPRRSGPPAPASRESIVLRLWRAAVPADRTPVRHYLAARLAWPPAGCGPDLPHSVRWLPIASAPPPDREAGWHGLPAAAAGAVLFRFDRIGGGPVAVSAEALAGDGERLTPRWRRTVGGRKGGLFDAGGPGSATVIAEGEIDALACRWLHPGSRCLGAGGTAGLAGAALPADWPGPVHIEADGDRPGRDAARKARRLLGRATVTWRQSGDPGDELAELVGSRAAVLEYEGGMDRGEAERASWCELLQRNGSGAAMGETAPLPEPETCQGKEAPKHERP